MYSPPRSLYCSMRILHCWKRCCRSSSDSLFMSSAAFAVTASTDSNLILFNADLIFGNKKKVTWGQVRWVRWMFQHGDLVLRQKRLDRQGVVCRRVVLVKNPWAFLPHFRSPFPHPLMKVCQNLLVVDLVNLLNFRHPIHVNNPSDVEKTIIIALNLDLLRLAFFCVGELGALPVHGRALTFWVVLKKTMIHHVITFCKKYESFTMFEEYQHKCSFEFPFVQVWGVSAPSSNTFFSCWNC